MVVGAVVPEEPRRAIVRSNEQIEIAIVVVITVRGAPSHCRFGEVRSYPGAQIVELPLAGVAKQVRRFRVRDGGLDRGDVVGDVTVRAENIRESIKIEIEEETAE